MKKYRIILTERQYNLIQYAVEIMLHCSCGGRNHPDNCLLLSSWIAFNDLPEDILKNSNKPDPRIYANEKRIHYGLSRLISLFGLKWPKKDNIFELQTIDETMSYYLCKNPKITLRQYGYEPIPEIEVINV